MNTIAILPKLCLKTLQRQNTKREIVKKVRFSKNIADVNSGTLKKYAPKSKTATATATATLDNKDNKEEPGLAIPVAASDSQTSLDTTSVIDTIDTIAAADTVAESGKSQHENAITLSLTE
jgi:hypothetical protein